MITEIRLASVAANLRRASALFEQASSHSGTGELEREHHWRLLGAAKWHLTRAEHELRMLGVEAVAA